LHSDRMSGKNAAIQQETQSFGGKSNEIVTLELDEGKTKQKGPSKVLSVEVVAEHDAETTYNEISSHSVQNANCKEVVTKLSSILAQYSSEIDFCVDSENNSIKNGVVIINNFYSVFFMIYVFKEENAGNTRFEFRRQSGDALASAKFLGDIKSQFFGNNNKEKEENTLIGLELNANDLELKVSDEDKERMMIHEALIDDDFVGDNLEEDAENYLYQKLVERKAIDAKNVIDHKILCQTLMDKSMLLHDDIAVVRASLLILKKFVSVYTELLLENDKLFALCSKVLKNQKFGLVKHFAVQLLAELAATDKKWKLEDGVRQNLKQEMKQFVDTNKDKKYYDQNMVDAVNKKL